MILITYHLTLSLSSLIILHDTNTTPIIVSPSIYINISFHYIVILPNNISNSNYFLNLTISHDTDALTIIVSPAIYINTMLFKKRYISILYICHATPILILWSATAHISTSRYLWCLATPRSCMEWLTWAVLLIRCPVLHGAN